jgi:hypothetical protein
MRSPQLSSGSKMWSVSFGVEELEEDEDGDISKDIILEMGSNFCERNF